MSDDTPWRVDTWMEGHGRAAYAGYWNTVGGRTHDDKPMPRWDKLTGPQQAAWTMAALAAIARHTDALKRES